MVKNDVLYCAEAAVTHFVFALSVQGLHPSPPDLQLQRDDVHMTSALRERERVCQILTKGREVA